MASNSGGYINHCIRRIQESNGNGQRSTRCCPVFGRWFDAKEQIAEAGQYAKQSQWWIKYSKVKV